MQWNISVGMAKRQAAFSHTTCGPGISNIWLNCSGYSLWMYSCKGSCHPVRMGHTSAEGLFHQSSRLEDLRRSGNLSLRQQTHQTATKKTTLSANHQNIMVTIILVKRVKQSLYRPRQSLRVPGRYRLLDFKTICIWSQSTHTHTHAHTQEKT
jgi:hypothetical protein